MNGQVSGPVLTSRFLAVLIRGGRKKRRERRFDRQFFPFSLLLSLPLFGNGRRRIEKKSEGESTIMGMQGVGVGEGDEEGAKERGLEEVGKAMESLHYGGSRGGGKWKWV